MRPPDLSADSDLHDTPPAGVPGVRATGVWRWVGAALKIAVSIGLMAWILHDADLTAVWAALTGVSLGWLALAFLLQFFGAGIIALRWRGLLAAKGGAPDLAYLYTSVLSAGFFRQFLPSIIGGDALRGYDAWRAGASPGLAAMSLVMDRLLGLVALAVFALIAVTLSDHSAEELPGVWLWIAFGLGGIVALLVVLLAPAFSAPAPVRALFERLPVGARAKLIATADAARTYRGQGLVIWRALALSALLQVNVITFYWVLSQSLGFGVEYVAFYIIAPLAIFVMMMPITINGVGLREAIFIFLLSLWAIDEPQALAFAWLEYGAFLAFGIFGGLVYIFRRNEFVSGSGLTEGAIDLGNVRIKDEDKK